ncbi:MAG: hypothetical protein EP335_17465 [Alphaproteobacteria bacterium]|nr:MAG: hypothetical protein EP335_17465 [Alphaproteobacteria bacterium]
MRTDIISGPLAEPLLLQEVKDHLRVTDESEDATLGALVTTVREMVEQHTGLMLLDRDMDLWLDQWPGMPADGTPWWNGVRDGAMADLARAQQFLCLPVRPVRQIAGIYSVAADGAETEWPAENWYLKPGHAPGLYRKQGFGWPAPGRAADGIRIRLTAGFGPSWNHVPAAVRQAMLMLVARLYCHRGDEDMAVALGASGAAGILKPYRELKL